MDLEMKKGLYSCIDMIIQNSLKFKMFSPLSGAAGRQQSHSQSHPAESEKPLHTWSREVNYTGQSAYASHSPASPETKSPVA